MSGVPSLTEQDILAVLQSLAQAQRRARRSASEASLFVPVRSLAGFSPEERGALAHATLTFFDLDGAEYAASGPSGGLLDALRERSCLESWAALLHARWTGNGLAFHSSGSTGIPVRSRHSLASMAEEGRVLAPFFASARRIVSVMPAHHIFGFMHSLWLAKFLGIPVLFTAPLPVAGFFASLREGDVVMGFPFFWQSVLSVLRQEGNGLRLPSGVAGVTATGPCPDWVIAGLRAKDAEGGAALASMQEIYGSTETNGIGIRHEGEAWYELYATWDAVPQPAGPRALIRRHGGPDYTGGALRADAGGVARRAGLDCSNSSAGSNRPNGPKSLDRPSEQNSPDRQDVADGKGGAVNCRYPFAEKPLPLPDVVEWHPADPRRFRPVRRTDAAVQVGGVNVYPEEVAALLRSHPLVRDCAVRLMRPEEGSRLKAFIVPACSREEAAQRFGREFRAWLAARLDPPCRPKHIRLGDSLPVNAMGKAADWG